MTVAQFPMDARGKKQESGERGEWRVERILRAWCLPGWPCNHDVTIARFLREARGKGRRGEMRRAAKREGGGGENVISPPPPYSNEEHAGNRKSQRWRGSQRR